MPKNYKYTKSQFLAKYIPLKSANYTNEKIAEMMGICRHTLHKYIKMYGSGPEIVAASEAAEARRIEVAENVGSEMIGVAYKLHKKGIQDAIKAGDYEKARDISIEALKIVKTEADIKRIFSVFVDARQQSVNITAGGKVEDIWLRYVDPVLRGLGVSDQTLTAAAERVEKMLLEDGGDGKTG